MSKTIYLFRHSEPADDRTIPTEQIPLSYEGRKTSGNCSIMTAHESLPEVNHFWKQDGGCASR